jgi:hypothetical protein
VHGLETSQVFAAAGAIIVFLGGLVLAGVRGTITRIKADIETMKKKFEDLHLDFVALQSEHKIICGDRDHGKRK